MLSVIIPVTGENRKEHAKACVHFLRSQKDFDDYEVVLIEQVGALLGEERLGGPFYSNLLGVDKYLSIRGPGDNYFNQPWMANVGAKIASGNKFLFYDIDIVCPETYLKAVNDFKCQFFIAWKPMVAMNKDKSMQVMQTKKLTADVLDEAENHKPGVLDYAGFSVCVSKSFFFNKLGGYNENYLGWGGNDSDIAWRASKVFNVEGILSHRLFHLWHPKEYSHFLRNKRRSIWLTTYKHPKKVNNKLVGVKRELGNPKSPTFIDIKDIYIDAFEYDRDRKKEKQK